MAGVSPLWAAAAVALVIALLAGWRDRVRKRRANLDRVDPFDWPTVQVLALIVFAICASIAAKG